MDLSRKRILQEAGKEIFERGNRIYKQDRVKLKDINLDKFEAQVDTRASYHVTVQQIGETLYSNCTCPYWATCKHVVAAMLKANEWYQEYGEPLKQKQIHPGWKQFFSKAMETVAQSTDSFPRTMQTFKIIYILSLTAESWSITPKKAYIKKDGTLGRLSNIGEFNLNDKDLIYAQNDPIIVSFLKQSDAQQKSFYHQRYFGHTHFPSTQMFHYKYGSRLGPLFDLLSDSVLFLNEGTGELSPLTFADYTARLELEVQEAEKEYHVVPWVHSEHKERLSPDYRILTEQPIWLLKDNALIKVKNQKIASLFTPFTKDHIEVNIPREEFFNFLEKTYGEISKTIFMKLPDSLVMRVIQSVNRKRIVLYESSYYLGCSLELEYDNHTVDYSNPESVLYRQESEGMVKIIREQNQEEHAVQQLKDTGIRITKDSTFRINNSKAMHWLFSAVPQLSKQGFEITGRNQLKRYKFRFGTPTVHVAVNSQIDWFDLNLDIQIDGVTLPISELSKSIRKGSRFVKLEDQSLAQLPEDWFNRFRHLFHFSQLEQGKIKVNEFHVTLIDALFEKAARMQTDTQYENSLKKLQNFQGIEQKNLPSNLKQIMRPYQKAGYDWMYFLKSYSFGGCLADDMGLGKTLQTLALLLNEKQNGNTTPSLIVCPTSVVFNWENECQKFTPALDILNHTGLSRNHSAVNFAQYDIILTTYGIMRRDISFLKGFRFHYIILDESQKIKNPMSQTAKASRLLDGQFRLVLTGTPVENNTIELWSQFSFLNPGLLGDLLYFKREFTIPIEKEKKERPTVLLRDMIYPFILRRTKEGVARELPPKLEQTYYCAMNPEQEKLYTHWKNHYRALILNKIESKGLERTHMNVLEGLVKLRQIACHPQLVESSIREDSGKLEYLMEIIEEIISEDHKVLLFSQFVKMLRLLRKRLDHLNISYAYLDGHTVKRKEVVHRFQTDKNVKIFLISLKAGGVGLNLTAADYVIHYDPWWNPAVEVQATDRAHRIGQKKRVFVYRLITKNSVEEKMLNLQAHKKKLVSDLITTDTTFFKSLTAEDIKILFE